MGAPKEQRLLFTSSTTLQQQQNLQTSTQNLTYRTNSSEKTQRKQYILTTTFQAAIANATKYMKRTPKRPRPQSGKLHEQRQRLRQTARTARAAPTPANRTLLRKAEREYRKAVQTTKQENAKRRRPSVSGKLTIMPLWENGIIFPLSASRAPGIPRSWQKKPH